MKIITWNCNMAFRKKAEFILIEEPDLLIIPECENLSLLSFGLYTKLPSGKFWYGDIATKGLGVFSYNGFKISPLAIHNPAFKYVLPLIVYNDKISITVLAIWAQKPEKHDNYTEQVWNAVNYYNDLLDGDNVILAGDFNSNTIFDKPKRICNHTSLVEFLKTKNIVSAYHQYYDQQQGKETTHTLFLQRKKDKPFHIDYCFLSKNLTNKLSYVHVGTYETWTKHSDHKPLTITLDI